MNTMLQNHNKKGVSIMVGYVLLIGLAIVMGGTTYVWMKSYIPKEPLECPAGTSLMIKDYQYNCGDLNWINLTLKNNGRFDIGGYAIHVSNSPGITLPTIDISGGCQQILLREVIPYDNSLIFNSSSDELGKNIFIPGNVTVHEFNLEGVSQIYYLQITPTRWQRQGKVLRYVRCESFKEEITCR